MIEYKQVSIIASNGELNVFRYNVGEANSLIPLFAKYAEDPERPEFGWLESGVLMDEMEEEFRKESGLVSEEAN